MRGLADSDCHVGFVVIFGDGVGVLGVGLLILENALGGKSDLLSRMHQRSLRKVKAGEI